MIVHTWKWILAASALAFLAPASAVLAGDQVPIKGRLTIVPDPNVPGQRLITGNVSHFGSVTGVNMVSVHFVSRVKATFTGMFTLTAANGDTIFGSDAGTLLFNPATGFFDVNEILMFMGGTGRFEGATGGATGVGQVDPSTNVAVESFEGVISSPGSLK
jgi:hypothetical protein